MKTHYEILGVAPNADPETIKAGYRRAVKIYHPDLHGGDKAAELRSKQITTAYAVLKDPKRRARYDEQLRDRRNRVRRFVITAMVSTGLVSGSTLFLLNLLLKPEVAAPLVRITGGYDRVSSAEDIPPEASINLAFTPQVTADAFESEPAAPPPAAKEAQTPQQAVTPPENAQADATREVWQKIDKDGNAEEIWSFVREHAGTPEAALAEKRLEPLIEAIDDAATLKALRAKATGAVADRVLRRLGHLAARDVVTAALPGQTADVPLIHAAPMAAVLDARPTVQEPAAGLQETASKAQGGLNSRSIMHRTLALLATGEYITAMPPSRDSAPLAPGNPKYYVFRAANLMEKGELDRALADYDAALLLDDVNIAAYHGRGIVHWRRGDTELALADFDRAIRLSFAEPKIYLDRGMIWYERGRYDRAIADFSQAIKLSPGLANAYSYRGTALRRKGEFKDAIADLEQAIRLNPAIEEAYRNRDLARTGRDDAVEPPVEVTR